MTETRRVSQEQPTAVLLEDDATLRDLEKIVLEEQGIRVLLPPPGVDVKTFLQQQCPGVFVMHVRWNHPEDVQLVDKLRIDLQTQAIPIVVISTSEEMAAVAQASPNVRESIVAPYDIDALQSAATHALKNPVPTEIIALRSRNVSPSIQFAAEELRKVARQVIVSALQEIRTVEPYKSQFPRLAPGLVDDLGTIVGALIDGVQHGLSPDEVFCLPEIHESIENHVKLRRSQGMGPVAAIREDQVLESQIDNFLTGLIGQSGFTPLDAIAAMKSIREYIAELVRIIAQEYTR